MRTATETLVERPAAGSNRCRVAAIWIDYYAYHLARLRALAAHPVLSGKTIGIELVGGAGVHSGLVFREEQSDDLPICTLLPDSGWRDVSQFAIARALWRKLNELDPAAVLVPGYYTLPGLAAAVWGRWRKRAVILMTESTAHDHPRTAWKEFCKGKLLRYLFDGAVAGGGPHIRYLRDLGFPAHRVAHPYNVVDNRFFALRVRDLRISSAPGEWGLPENYFLYVGRLAEEKGLVQLIEAYEEYRRQGGLWSLEIVGDGPLRKQLEARAAAGAYSRDIHFCGLKTTAELPPYYAFARCFVLPSTREPWGLVVNEAMACGLPVIVSVRCGCAEDLVQSGANGYLFEPQQAGELAACLLRMETATVQERAAMGRKSLELVGRFSPENWAEAVVRILAVVTESAC